MDIAYFITLSEKHLLSAIMMLRTLRPLTSKKVLIAGNLKNPRQIDLLYDYGAEYIDENEINLTGRLPKVNWKNKFREFGWYKQQFLRLAIDRFITEEYAVILDSETFFFDNWNESELFGINGNHKVYSWIPSVRKPVWDYMMYKGAAYMLRNLPGCRNIMDFADSDSYPRHITGMAVFSTKNMEALWKQIEQYDPYCADEMLNKTDYSFSEYELYGLASRFGLFNSSKIPELYDGFCGWYDVHNDVVFENYKKNAMWSMCQDYKKYSTSFEYWAYMVFTAKLLGKKFPRLHYWNIEDELLIDKNYDEIQDINYFRKYQIQLNYTSKKMYAAMFYALRHISQIRFPVIVETSTMRDCEVGGLHSTYKFAEFVSKYNGKVHSVDFDKKAADFAKIAVFQYIEYVEFHTCNSIEFLSGFDKKIDLLYIDNQNFFEGTENNISNRQFSEIKTAFPKLSDKCAVLLNRTASESAESVYSSEFFEKNGFKLLRDDYQKLYVRDI